MNAHREMARLTCRRIEALESIFKAAKALVPALRDLGQNHQADRLEAELSDYELVDREMATFAKEHTEAVLDQLEKMLRRGSL